MVDIIQVVVAVVVIVVGVIGGLALYARRYVRVPPNMAMVVFGRKRGDVGYNIVRGGGQFIIPIFEDYAYLPLNIRTLEIVVTDIVTDVMKSGAKVNIKAVAQVKVASDEASLETAAEVLLHKTDEEINQIAMKTLEGHVRGICATMTIEAINSDRDELARSIQSLADKDLKNMGMGILSFVIKEVEDDKGYLDALGRGITAEVKRDARIREANANRDATIREAEAAREAEKANAEAEARVAEFHRDRDLIKQRAEGLVETERANKEISYDIQSSKRQQELVREKIQIEIEQKKKQIEMQENEITRKEKEQTAVQVVPAKAEADAKVASAEGEKGKIIKLAEGEREKLRIEAEGERDKRKMVADGEAQRIRAEGTAEADIIKLKGQAEGEAIRAKGLAAAEAMQKKAAAWREYGSAAVTQMIVEQLPEMVKQAALPLVGVEKIIVLGSEGPAGLVNKTVDIAAQMPALVKSLTGMDITDLVGRVAGLTTSGPVTSPEKKP
jgi:flotillin